MKINVYEVICPVVSRQPIIVAGQNMKDAVDAMIQNYYDETVSIDSEYVFKPEKIESIKKIGESFIASDKSIELVKKNLF